MRDMAEYMQKRRIKIPIRLDGELLLINENELLQINKILLHRNEKDLLEMLQCNGNVLQINIKIGIFGEKTQVFGENPSRGGMGGDFLLNSASNPNGTSTHKVLKEKNKIKKEKVCENHSEEIEKNFEVFWQAYPRCERKMNRDGTKKKLSLALRNKGLTFEKIMQGLEYWKAKWDNPRFIPAPVVWLNNRYWEAMDNAPDTKPSQPPRTAYIAPPAEEKRQTMSDAELVAMLRGAK